MLSGLGLLVGFSPKKEFIASIRRLEGDRESLICLLHFSHAKSWMDTFVSIYVPYLKRMKKATQTRATLVFFL